jgi:hypothetical protein
VPAWATVAITLGAAAIAVAGTLAGTWIQLRHSRREREAAERREWVEKGSAALAPITTLLTNLEPDRLTVSASEQMLRDVADLRARWEATARIPLAAFALSHPSPGVRELATKLDVHVEWVLIRGASLVGDVLQSRDWREVQAMVWSHYRDAQRLVEELHAAIHADADVGRTGGLRAKGRGNQVVTRGAEAGRELAAGEEPEEGK